LTRLRALRPLSSCRARKEDHKTATGRGQASELARVLIRAKGEHLGVVEAPDRERAKAVAIKQFDLDQDQRSRLLIRERL
jgi:hypothetical protein